MRSLYFPSCYLQNLDRKICIRRKINRKKILILKFSCKISSVVVLLLKIIIIIIVCLIKTSSGSQKTELHDVKCYKVINSKKILYYNAI